MRLVSALGAAALLASASASAQPIVYEVSGEGIAVREQAFVLDVLARAHADEEALARARLRGRLRLENTREVAATLVLEVREDEVVAFEYRAEGQLACFEAADPDPEEESKKLQRQFSGRLALPKANVEGCLKMGPVAALPRGGEPPARGRLVDRHRVSVRGKALAAAASRWEATVQGCAPEPGAKTARCEVRAAQVAEYRIELPAKGELEVDLTDSRPLRARQGCCSRVFEGSFGSAWPPAGGRVTFAAPDPMASRCRTIAHGWADTSSRVGGYEVFESGPVSANEGGWRSMIDVACDVDDGQHVDHWPARVATVAAESASSVLDTKTEAGEAAFGAAALVDGSMTPWCSAAGAGPGQYVELDVKEEVAAVSLAQGEGPRVFAVRGRASAGGGPPTPSPSAPRLARSGRPPPKHRSPTRVEIVPAGGGAALASVVIPAGAVAVTAPVKLGKGRWRVVVAAATQGQGPICIGEVDLVPARDRKALEASALLRGLLKPAAPR